MFRSSITYGNNPKVNLTQKITYIKWSPEQDDIVYTNGRLDYYASPKTNVMLEDTASEHLMNESIERITFESTDALSQITSTRSRTNRSSRKSRTGSSQTPHQSKTRTPKTTTRILFES